MWLWILLAKHMRSLGTQGMTRINPQWHGTLRRRARVCVREYGFILGRNIFYNVLNVQMATDYVLHTRQEMIMVQLDFEKTYHHVN